MSKHDFENWLIEEKRLTSSSAKKYSGVINTLSKKSGVDFFNVTNSLLIDKYYEQYGYKEKDTKGNRMYISGINHFKEFVNDVATTTNEIIKDIRNYEMNIAREINKNTNIPVLSFEPSKRPNYRELSKRNIWERDPKIASEVIQVMNFQCEGNQDHNFFISNRTGKNYVEAHHLIPMEYQDDFEYSLDVHANIVSLCPVCHKKVHHGTFEEIIELVGNLYSERKIQLQKSNINISFDELSSLYK